MQAVAMASVTRYGDANTDSKQNIEMDTSKHINDDASKLNRKSDNLDDPRLLRTLLSAESLISITDDPIRDALITAYIRTDWSLEVAIMRAQSSRAQEASTIDVTNTRPQSPADGKSKDAEQELYTLLESLHRLILHQAGQSPKTLSEVDRLIGLKVLEAMISLTKAQAEGYAGVEPPAVRNLRAERICKLENAVNAWRTTSTQSGHSVSGDAHALKNGQNETATTNVPIYEPDLASSGQGREISPMISDYLQATIASFAACDRPHSHCLRLAHAQQTPGSSLFDAGCRHLARRREDYLSAITDPIPEGCTSAQSDKPVREDLARRFAHQGVLYTALTWLGHHEPILDSADFRAYIIDRQSMKFDRRVLIFVGNLLRGIEKQHAGDGAVEVGDVATMGMLGSCARLRAVIEEPAAGPAASRSSGKG